MLTRKHVVTVGDESNVLVMEFGEFEQNTIRISVHRGDPGVEMHAYFEAGEVIDIIRILNEYLNGIPGDGNANG